MIQWNRTKRLSASITSPGATRRRSVRVSFTHPLPCVPPNGSCRPRSGIGRRTSDIRH